MNKEIVIRNDSIRLGQLLKLAGVVETGGEGKQRIQSGEAKVNGLIETKRGRQLFDGDEIELAGKVLRVVRKDKDPGGAEGG